MTTRRSLVIPGDEWEQVRRSVAVAASRDEARPILTCVHLAVKNGRRKWWATDSYRLHQLEGGESKAADRVVSIPRGLFGPARRRKHPAPVTVSWTRSDGRITADDRTPVLFDPGSVTWRPPRFGKINPGRKRQVGAVSVDRRELRTNVDLLPDPEYAGSSRPIVLLAGDGDATIDGRDFICGLRVRPYGPNGDGRGWRPCEHSRSWSGATLVGVDRKYLLDAVKSMPDRFELHLFGGLKPIVLHGGRLRALVMPMRLGLDGLFGDLPTEAV